MAIDVNPCLAFATDAEAAATRYAGLFPDSAITSIVRVPPSSPLPEGSVMVIEMRLAGRPLVLLNGPPVMPGHGAVSLVALCDTQAEVDRLWDALTEGGTPQGCGWLIDRFGVTWQVIPKKLTTVMSGGTAEGRARAMNAMMAMMKIDGEALERIAAEA